MNEWQKKRKVGERAGEVGLIKSNYNHLQNHHKSKLVMKIS